MQAGDSSQHTAAKSAAVVPQHSQISFNQQQWYHSTVNFHSPPKINMPGSQGDASHVQLPQML
jgi:hypothetical protein